VALPGETVPEEGEQEKPRAGDVRQAMQDYFDSQARRPDQTAHPRRGSGGASARPRFQAGSRQQTGPHLAPGAPSERPAAQAPSGERALPRYGNCMQMCDAYIVEETPDGVNLIDQHALHERILYNKLSARIEGGTPTSQQLLVPELVELPRQEFYAVMELEEDLARFGMQIEAFGESTVLVRSFPQMLGHFDGEAFFRELLEEFDGPEGLKRVDGRLDGLIKMMACKAAVKAGQRLDAAQLRKLLEQRAEWSPTDTCPHGRPTTIHLSRSELDKQFHRT
jgi:DNA mismatch repair ATPase MutL